MIRSTSCSVHHAIRKQMEGADHLHKHALIQVKSTRGTHLCSHTCHAVGRVGAAWSIGLIKVVLQATGATRLGSWSRRVLKVPAAIRR